MARHPGGGCRHTGYGRYLLCEIPALGQGNVHLPVIVKAPLMYLQVAGHIASHVVDHLGVDAINECPEKH